MDWDDPSARYALIERVGIEEYNRLFAEHIIASTVATVASRPIRVVVSQQWGRIYMVDGLNRGFRTLPEAEKYAMENPKD